MLLAMCLALVLVVASVSALDLALPDLALALSASFADSTNMLIVWRVVMGLGAAMIMPGTLSTITAAFRHTKDDHPGPPDVHGAVTTALGIGTLVYAVIEGNEQGWTEPAVIGALVVTAVSFAAYACLGLRSEHPLLDIPGFRAGAVTVLVQFMAVFGFFFVGLQYLQLILDYSPLKAALALVPVAVVVLPTSAATPHLTRREVGRQPQRRPSAPPARSRPAKRGGGRTATTPPPFPLRPLSRSRRAGRRPPPAGCG
ncbi:hypothetical protein ACQEWB_06420 [Streptomyces sp. CA-249302]|uniref:hypothetical protein n=1 Tax=Streptomyces sp. CA-249302 TaxID=3240058 RepID=UPI003D949786